MSRRRTYADRRSVAIPDPLWQALQLVADLRRVSISQVLREAAEQHVERYGLVMRGHELMINPLLWPTEVVEGKQTEIFQGDRAEIFEGDQISPGDQI
jgi:hypothetical protein